MGAYAPNSGRPDDEKGAYADSLQRCIHACGSAILFVGTDANAFIGERSSYDAKGTAGYRIYGQHGIERENIAGPHLCTFLGANGLCAATAFTQDSERRHV